MRTESLRDGDRIEVRLNGGTFEATYKGLGDYAPKPHRIEPVDPYRTTRNVSAKQIVKKLGSEVAG